MHMMESALHIKTAPAVEVDMRPIQRGMCTLKSTNVSTINFCAYHSTCNAINPSIGPPLFVPVLQPDPFTDCTCCDVSPNTQSCLQHYQCSQIRKMKLDDIDPCIAVCLFCKCEEDFHDLCARQEELSGTLQVEPIFVVEDDEPNYEEMACVQAMMSGDLDEDEEDDFVLM